MRMSSLCESFFFLRCTQGIRKVIMPVAKRIIPCLDVDKGRVVKGVNFLNIRDAGDPVEIAKRYDTEGADEITMLDITASHETRDTTYKTVESIALSLIHI